MAKHTYRAQYKNEDGLNCEVTRNSEREYNYYWYWFGIFTDKHFGRLRQGQCGFSKLPKKVPAVGSKSYLGKVVCSGCIQVEIIK